MVNTKRGQTVKDLLLQESGSMEALEGFLRDNDLALDGHFGADDTVIAPEVTAPSTVEYFRRRGLRPATGAHNPLRYPGGSYSTSYSNAYD